MTRKLFSLIIVCVTFVSLQTQAGEISCTFLQSPDWEVQAGELMDFTFGFYFINVITAGESAGIYGQVYYNGNFKGGTTETVTANGNYLITHTMSAPTQTGSYVYDLQFWVEAGPGSVLKLDGQEVPTFETWVTAEFTVVDNLPPNPTGNPEDDVGLIDYDFYDCATGSSVLTKNSSVCGKVQLKNYSSSVEYEIEHVDLDGSGLSLTWEEDDYWGDPSKNLSELDEDWYNPPFEFFPKQAGTVMISVNFEILDEVTEYNAGSFNLFINDEYTEHDRTGCYNSNIYWYDSLNQPNDLVQTCNYGCENSQCLSDPCAGYDLCFIYGSIGCSADLQKSYVCQQIGDCLAKMYTFCGSHKVCDGGQCVCDHQCYPPGVDGCYDDWTYKVCKEDFNGCRYWEYSTCQCYNGQCLNPGSECDYLGQNQCINNTSLWYCVFDSEQSIFVKFEITCPDGYVCQDAACVPDCLDECVDGQKKCLDDQTLATCGEYDGDPCLEWGNEFSCPCYNGQCKTCTDECDYDGQAGCVDLEHKWLCKENQENGCFEKTVFECSDTFGCIDGKCLKICDHNCDYEGQVSCLDENTLQTCGYQDDDPCLEWGEFVYCMCINDACQLCQECEIGTSGCLNTSQSWVCEENPANGCTQQTTYNCAVGEICFAGQCMCVDECDTVGQKQCDGDSAVKICGNYDADNCLEWSALQACPDGCQNGKCLDCSPAKAFIDCNGDKLVWRDACWQVSELIKDCSQMPDVCNDQGNGYYTEGFCSVENKTCYYALNIPCELGCSGGQCLNCVDQCDYAGQAGCSDVAKFWYCWFNPGTGCFEKGYANCLGEEKCYAGECKIVCENECQQAGQTACYGKNSYHVCVEDDAGCLSWGSQTNCPQNYNCQEGECVQSACQIVSASWSTDSVNDGTVVELVVQVAGDCENNQIEAHIIEDDIFFNDDSLEPLSLSFDNNLAVAEWQAIWLNEKGIDLTNCDGKVCINNPEYFLEIYIDNEKEYHSKNDELGILEVTAYEGVLSLEEYSQYVEYQNNEQAFYEPMGEFDNCFDITDSVLASTFPPVAIYQNYKVTKCVELFMAVQEEPFATTYDYVSSKLSNWWYNGWKTVTPSNLIYSLVACAACQNDMLITGKGFLALMPEGLIDVDIDILNYFNPFSYFGEDSCQICMDHAFDILDSPPAVIADIVGVGLKLILKRLGKEVAETGVKRIIASDGIGAKFVYKQGDDEILQVVSLRRVGNDILVNIDYFKQPLYLKGNGKDFYKFNVYNGGKFKDFSHFTSKQKDFMLSLLNDNKLQLSYARYESMIDDIAAPAGKTYDDVVMGIAFAPGAEGGGGAFIHKYKRVILDLDFVPPLEGLSKADTLIYDVLGHESFHGLTDTALEFHGLDVIKNEVNVVRNYPREFFDQYHLLKKLEQYGSVDHVQKLRQSIKAFIHEEYYDYGGQMLQMVTAPEPMYTIKKHQWHQLYALAQKTGDYSFANKMETDLFEYFSEIYPNPSQEVTKVLAEVDEMISHADSFTDNMFNDGATSYIQEVVDKYDLNVVSMVVQNYYLEYLISIGVVLDDEYSFDYVHHQEITCFGGNLWWLDSDGEYYEVFQGCDGHGCLNNTCLTADDVDPENYDDVVAEVLTEEVVDDVYLQPQDEEPLIEQPSACEDDFDTDPVMGIRYNSSCSYSDDSSSAGLWLVLVLVGLLVVRRFN